MLPKSSSIFLKILFYGLLAAIPLGIRHQQSGFFLYASDLIALLFLGVFFFELRGIFWPKPKFLIWFLFFAGLSIFPALSYQIAVYNFLHLLLLASAALAAAKCLRVGLVSLEGVARTLGLSAVAQSVIAILQFWKQGSIGLGFFGEPLLGENIAGVAKIAVEAGKVVRAYGTFPHPNVLAAFLLLGLSALIFLWLKRSNLLSATGIFAISLGLLLTFSRTGWAIAVLVVLTSVGAAVFSQNRRSGWQLLILMAVVVGMLALLFRPYISARALISADEPAVTLRAAYNKISLEIISSHPLGVGIGNQVAFTRESGLYEKFGLTEPWQEQPIHNLYLLMATEIGILGALAFLIFLIRLLFSHSERSEESSGSFAILRMTAKTMLAALLLFGLTDHFLWTYQPGQLMLWLTVGLALGFQLKPVDNL